MTTLTRAARPPLLNKRRLFRWLALLTLVLVTLFYLLPVYLMLITGMKNLTEVDLTTMWRLPSGLNFASFEAAWDALSPHLLNSLLLAVPAWASYEGRAEGRTMLAALLSGAGGLAVGWAATALANLYARNTLGLTPFQVTPRLAAVALAIIIAQFRHTRNLDARAADTLHG